MTLSGSSPSPRNPRSTSGTNSAAQAFERAVRDHLAGDLEAAARGYRRTLALAPATAEAHNNLGVILREGDVAAAVGHFSEAVRLAPTYADGLINLGLGFRSLGKLDEALEAFRAAVAAHPQNSKALNNLGQALRELGRMREAEEVLRHAIALAPAEPAFLIGLGNVCLETARIDDAIAAYQAALEINPDHHEALNNLGGAYRALRNMPEAIRCFRRALDLQPDFLDALHNLSLALPPDIQTARDNEAILRYAAERNPHDPAYGAVLATMLQESGRIEEAEEVARQVLARDAANVSALNVMAMAAIHHLDNAEALRCCERVLAIDPRNRTALWNRSLSLLGLGDYARGWEAYESRWDLVHFALDRRTWPQPEWKGEAIDGKTLLLYTEQGLGDGIQFIRFAKLVKQRWNARIIVEATAALAPLFRTCPWVDDVFPRGQQLPEFDLHAAILSLPHLLGVTLEDLSSEPYLEARPRPITSRIADTGRLRVGLVWGGGTPTPALAWRSLRLEQLRPLLELDGIDFYSLQKGDAAEQLSSFSLRERITDLGPDLVDFTDTAAAIAELDLVVTVDTSVAHLAGALGRRVWIMLIRSADWRWFTDREDSPWYASARLFRQQEHGDWDPVVARIRDAVRQSIPEAALVGARTSGPGVPASTEMATEIASVQRLTSGAARFILRIPLAALASELAMDRFQAEASGTGVDPELRRFLEDELRSGDVFVDLAPGWGFASLSVATLPDRSVAGIAVIDDPAQGSIIERATRENRLTGDLRTESRNSSAAIDHLAPPSRFGGDALLFARAGADADPSLILRECERWRSARRLGAIVWDSAPSAGVLRDAVDLEHFRMEVDEQGPVFVPFTGQGSGPVFSVAPRLLERNNAPAAAAPEPVFTLPAGVTIRRRVGIDWQVGTNSGWGVYGRNLVRRALETGRAFPMLFTTPDTRELDSATRKTIQPALDVHAELVRRAAGPGTTFDAAFPVLRALGNRMMGGSAGIGVRAAADVGVIFFEDTRLDPDALSRGRQLARIVAGSTWNADVLRGYGLDHVETCLQGIDPGLFRPAAPSGRFGDRFVVFSGGKLEFRKGQDLVVAAFREFARRHSDALLVTAWHNHWPATMAEVVNAGHVRGVPAVAAGGRIDFATWMLANGLPRDSFLDLGNLPHSAMADAIREAHVALFPNRCEGGTNLVAMECMAAGIPTILSANTGHLDIVSEDGCYPLLDQGPVPGSRQFLGTDGWGESSVDEILEKLETAYSDRGEALRRGAAGAEILAQLTWDRQIDRMLDLLDDLLPND